MAFPTCNTTWRQTIATHRLLKSAHIDTMFDKYKIIIAVNQAIAHAEATGRFILPGDTLKKIQPATRPLVMNFTDGETLQSTHTGNLDLPWFPEEATYEHVLPGLAHTSLVSIKILCDYGFKVLYKNKNLNLL